MAASGTPSFAEVMKMWQNHARKPLSSDNRRTMRKAIRKEVKKELSEESWHKENLTFVVFGASGDLAKKKTYPSLFDLFKGGHLPKHTVIMGYARSAKQDAEFRQHLKPFLLKKADEHHVDEFLKLCYYRNGGYDDSAALNVVSKEATSMHGSGVKRENRIFYLALPPSAFVSTCASIKQGGMSSNGYNRVIVEKPFGHDTESARELGVNLGKIFSEDHLYRIDHYLGKEMVQNLIVFRFANPFIEDQWSNRNVASVIISFKEDIGTMGRGGYFDASGIIRDVMQNHLMQVLSIVAMEPPAKAAGAGSNEMLRDEKVKVLKAIKPISMSDVVLGQYVGNGDEPGYLEDPTVPKGSNCPTYCAAIMHVNNKRWAGVPFVMKAGKALNERRAEVRIQFKTPIGVEDMFDGQKIPRNELVIRLQPSEAIYMKTNVKRPGLQTAPIQSELDLSYTKRYKDVEIFDAYTRLVLDVLRGKQATFVRDDELMAAWEIFTPLLHNIRDSKVKPIPYKFGSRGPKEADRLIEKKGGYQRFAEYSWS